MSKVFALLLLFMTFAFDVRADDERKLESKISIGNSYFTHSKILNENQKYTVILPLSYAKNLTKTYPVVYVLDGRESRALLTSSILQANRETFPALVPEAIVVGIPSNRRFRDYTPIQSNKNLAGETMEWMSITGGAENYRKYLREELFPQIAKNYRTNGHRVLIGHSLGGLFALNDLLSKGHLFQSYVVIDPSLWFGDNYLERKVTEVSSERLEGSINMYMAVALADVDEKWGEAATAFSDQVKQKKSENFYFKQDVSKEENHNSIATMATHDGLRYAFKGYAAPALEDIAKEPSLVVDHIDAFSKRVGSNYKSEELWVRMSGYNALNNDMAENAYELFQMNVENYPDNSISWGTLGVYYEKIGKLSEAIEAYTRALELNPMDRFAKAKIVALTKKN